MNTFQFTPKSVISSVGSNASIQIVRQAPEGSPSSAETQYLNEVMGSFIRTLVKVYNREGLAKSDKLTLKRYLDQVIHAREIMDAA